MDIVDLILLEELLLIDKDLPEEGLVDLGLRRQIILYYREVRESKREVLTMPVEVVVEVVLRPQFAHELVGHDL